MPRKPKGPGGGPPLIPINGGRKNAKSPTLDKPEAPSFPDMVLPQELITAKVTTRALRTGTYQRKLMAFFAPELLGQFFNSVRRNLHLSDPATQRLAAEMFQLVNSGKGAVSVMVNQTNANNNDNKVAAVARGSGPSTPDEMYRMLADEREKRAELGRASIEFIATPGSEFKPKLLPESGE